MSKTGGGRGTNQYQVQGHNAAARGAVHTSAEADARLEALTSRYADVIGNHEDIDAAMLVTAEGTREETAAAISRALDRCHPRNTRTVARLRESLELLAEGRGRETVQHRIAQAGTDLPWGHSNANPASRPRIIADQTCTSCGTHLVNGANFCTQCGTPYEDEVPPSKSW